MLQCLSPGERSKKSSFYDDNENNTFGVMDKKEGTYNPKSDFAFTFSMCAKSPGISGYFCSVKAEGTDSSPTKYGSKVFTSLDFNNY